MQCHVIDNYWKISIIYSLIIFAIPGFASAKESSGIGPIFIVEPPRKIAFLNSRGAVIDCLVHGDPNPKVQWIDKNGEKVFEVQGLLKVLPNNSLSLPKFDNGLYRQNIHSTIYRCKASNRYGTIVSREVQVTAVVEQHYKTQVYDEYVIEGNTAVLKCNIPSYIKDYIKVTAWIRDDETKIPIEYQHDSRYTLLMNGNLNIINIDYGDSNSNFKCQTEHRVSGDVIISQTGGKLHITKPSSGIQPRIVYSHPSMDTVSGYEVTISCVAQGYPAPIYSWCYRKNIMTPCEEIRNVKGKTVIGNIIIMLAQVHHSGFYECMAKNNMGEAKTATKLTVYAPLSAFIHPQKQIVDIGEAVNISCVMSGGPFKSIKWFKDGHFLEDDEKSLDKSKSALNMSSVVKTTEGMYQCFVSNNMDEKQAIGQIILSAVPPSLEKVFSRKQGKPGHLITLECFANGDPLPQIYWSLRDSVLKGYDGINIETEVKDGKTWSKLTIVSLKTTNGGIYRCTAKNKAGEDSYANILDVYGLPRVWPLKNQTVVTGMSVSIQCHVSGYPIKSIKWKKDGEHLLESERMKIYKNGTLNILSAIGDADHGKYECIAESEDGYTSSGTGMLKIIVAPIIGGILNRTLRLGQRLNLICDLRAGDPPIEFTWNYNGQLLPHNLGLIVSDSAYSSTLNYPKVKRKHMGNYTCIAKNNAGYAAVSSIIKVQAPPAWEEKPTKTDVAFGQSTLLPCSGKGYPQPKTTWMKLNGKKSEEIVSKESKMTIYTNGSLKIKNISKDDIQSTYQCKISNGLQPSLLANIQLILKKNIIQFEMLQNTFQVAIGTVVEIKCNASGIGPFNVKWTYGDKTLSKRFNSRIDVINKQRSGSIESILKMKNILKKDGGLYTCQISNKFILNSTRILVTVSDKNNKIDTRMPGNIGYPIMTSIATFLDESSSGQNDTSAIIPLSGIAILYIIPTVTAAIILLVILIIVCVLLQGQRSKKKQYIHQAKEMKNSAMMSKNLEDEDKMSDFYKTSSGASSNKYYELRPTGSNQFPHPYQNYSTYKPGECEIEPYATFTTDSKDTDTSRKPSLEMRNFC